MNTHICMYVHTHTHTFTEGGKMRGREGEREQHERDGERPLIPTKKQEAFHKMLSYFRTG